MEAYVMYTIFSIPFCLFGRTTLKAARSTVSRKVEALTDAEGAVMNPLKVLSDTFLADFWCLRFAILQTSSWK